MLFAVVVVPDQEASVARATLQRLHGFENHRSYYVPLGNALWIVDGVVGGVLLQVYVARQRCPMFHRCDVAVKGKHGSHKIKTVRTAGECADPCLMFLPPSVQWSDQTGVRQAQVFAVKALNANTRQSLENTDPANAQTTS